MSQRKRRRPRCEGCGLRPELCACALLPEVAIETPIVIVQHIRERHKPTNTVRLLATMVPGLPVVHFGMREPPFDTSPLLRDDVDFHVLFPRDDATVLRAPEDGDLGLVPAPGRKLGFVVLDGTWHQCSRMARRVPKVESLGCVALPPGVPSIWGVRTQHDPRGVSTFEAVLRLLALTEAPERLAPLQRAFEIVTARALFMKGKLRTPEVPEHWPSDPWADAAAD